MKGVARAICAAMRLFFTSLLALGLVFLASLAQAAFINGQNYTPLAAWVRANGFYGYTLNRGNEIILTNRNSRFVFDVDSAQAQINGVNVRLSFPVAGQKNIPSISQFDIETTIRPLLYPQRLPAKKILTICIDPGHGGKDTGEHVGGFFGRSEKTYTLALALELRDQLKKAGFKVVMTRTTDAFIKLPERAAIANQNGADLFVCLHFNAAQTEKDQIQGPETYCITPTGANSSNDRGENGEFDTTANVGPTLGNRNEQKSLLLAYQLQKSLVENLHAYDRGVKHARFEVLRETAMPGILLEGGFMTHPVEGRRIFDAGYRKQMAAAIVRGILTYQRLTAPPIVPPASNKSSKPK
jgi:N-acetylmuramoyl-L-alanine amidase